MSEFGEGEEQGGTFSIFFAEGEALAKQRQYRKAIESFTKVCSCQTKSPMFQSLWLIYTPGYILLMYVLYYIIRYSPSSDGGFRPHRYFGRNHPHKRHLQWGSSNSFSSNSISSSKLCVCSSVQCTPRKKGMDYDSILAPTWTIKNLLSQMSIPF